jgi:hyperosmotically inducible periplasmic protein
MRFAFRAVLMIAIIAMGAYLLGFWSPSDVVTGRWRWTTPTAGAADTGGVRDRLDQLDKRSVQVAQRVDDYVSDAGLSGKIKSKMALDEVVRARTIDVSTTGGVVTLAGTVRSAAERDQALKLARDTAGVTQVVDHLVVLP